jgi:excisionase family DNA binding protein
LSIQSSNIEEFLTVAEVAELLKLNQQTVRNWIDQGSLPAVRVGRRVRIRRSDLERKLEEGSTGRAAIDSGEAIGPSAEDFWGGEPVGVAEAPHPAGDDHAPVVPDSNDPRPR